MVSVLEKNLPYKTPQNTEVWGSHKELSGCLGGVFAGVTHTSAGTHLAGKPTEKKKKRKEKKPSKYVWKHKG